MQVQYWTCDRLPRGADDGGGIQRLNVASVRRWNGIGSARGSAIPLAVCAWDHRAGGCAWELDLPEAADP